MHKEDHERIQLMGGASKPTGGWDRRKFQRPRNAKWKLYITDRNACPPASKDMHKRAHSKLFMIVLTQSSSTVGWVNEW